MAVRAVLWVMTMTVRPVSRQVRCSRASTCLPGHVWLDGQDVSRFSEKELTQYRRYDVGFVFQFYNLVQNLTALENVELASEICRDPLDPKATLESVGLGERLNNLMFFR